MKKRHLVIAALALSVAGFTCASAYAQKPKITKVKTPAKKTDADSAEPDKVLYDRAMNDLKHDRYTEARLDFQTLINTYPDSEYLAKAKLAVADSYYKEGGTSSLTQAVEEYKNFIVFFPFLDEAAYAQMQVGMAHYKMTEKPDRDNSQAMAAEDEFQAFLLKYPQSPLVPQAEQYLRNVQEVLADGEFRIAQFYYVKQDYRASAARLIEVSSRYPLYSQSDEALSMLGSIYERAKRVSKNEDDKNHWADLAAQCYDRILRDYPASKLAPMAKAQLTAMAMPVPPADPAALARMRNEQMYQRQHHANAILKFPMGMIKSSPDVYAAAHSGQPNLSPPDDLVSATDVLNQGARGPSFTVATVGVSTSPSGGGGGAGSDTESAPVADTDSDAPHTNAPVTATDAQIIGAPGNGAVPSSASPTPAAADPPAPNAPAEASSAVSTSTTPAPATNEGSSTSQPSNSSSAQTAASSSNPKSESTSKKKKHKLIPF